MKLTKPIWINVEFSEPNRDECIVKIDSEEDLIELLAEFYLESENDESRSEIANNLLTGKTKTVRLLQNWEHQIYTDLTLIDTEMAKDLISHFHDKIATRKWQIETYKKTIESLKLNK